MPKNNKKKKATPKIEHETMQKDDDHEYAIVTKTLGDGKFRLKLNLSDREIIGRVCGKLKQRSKRKSNWVDVGSVVMVGIRDFQDKIVDIVYVFVPDEIRRLKKDGVLSGDVKENVEEADEDLGFDFNEI